MQLTGLENPITDSRALSEILETACRGDRFTIDYPALKLGIFRKKNRHVNARMWLYYPSNKKEAVGEFSIALNKTDKRFIVLAMELRSLNEDNPVRVHYAHRNHRDNRTGKPLLLMNGLMSATAGQIREMTGVLQDIRLKKEPPKRLSQFTDEQQRQIVDEWFALKKKKGAKISQDSFAKRHGITGRTLRTWKNKQKRK